MLERLRFRYKVLLLVAPALAGAAAGHRRRPGAQPAGRGPAGPRAGHLPAAAGAGPRPQAAVHRDPARARGRRRPRRTRTTCAEADDLRAAVHRPRWTPPGRRWPPTARDASALRQDLDDYYRAARDVTEPPDGGAGRRGPGRSHGGDAEPAPAPDHPAGERRLARPGAHGRPPSGPPGQAHNQTLVLDVLVALAALLVAGLLSWRIIGGSVRSLQEVQAGVERLARGDFGQEIRVSSRDEFGDLARQANETAARLREYREKSTREDWLKTGLGGLATELAGEQSAAELGARRPRLPGPLPRGAGGGACTWWTTTACCACAPPTPAPSADAVAGDLPAGRGDPGRGAAATASCGVIDQVPAGHLVVRSALVEGSPRQMLVAPFSHERRVMGVLELGSLTPFTEQQLEVVRRARDVAGDRLRGGPVAPAAAGAAGPDASARPRSCSRSRRSCARPTTSWPSRPGPWSWSASRCWRRTPSWRAPSSCCRRRPTRWPAPAATSPSSWPTCRTSCARP